MNKDDKPTRGIDWAAIFERRPDLQPPGYHETIAKLKTKRSKTNES